MSTHQPWWQEGVRFECQETGRCCVSRDSYGYVYLSLEDRRRLARHLGLRTGSFTRRYCRKTDGYFHLKDVEGACMFLRGKRCGVYQGRPNQCRTWPFWPENIESPADWEHVRRVCPGSGSGQWFSLEQIQASARQTLS